MRLYQIIREGLIKSLPLRRILSILKNKGINATKVDDTIWLVCDKKIKSQINNILNVVGWFIATENNRGEALLLVVEPTRGHVLNGIPDILYHATEAEDLPRIKKIGLVPNSKSKLSNHPDRVYASISIAALTPFIHHFIYGLSSPIILTIDTKKTDNKWYADPNLSGGVYTTTNVPPVALTNFIEYDKVSRGVKQYA